MTYVIYAVTERRAASVHKMLVASAAQFAPGSVVARVQTLSCLVSALVPNKSPHSLHYAAPVFDREIVKYFSVILLRT